MTDEEQLDKLRIEQKKLDELILKSRKRIAQIREETAVLEPKVTAARAKKEWKEKEPEREAIRQTKESQEWRKDFLAKEELRVKELMDAHRNRT